MRLIELAAERLHDQDDLEPRRLRVCITFDGPAPNDVQPDEDDERDGAA